MASSAMEAPLAAPPEAEAPSICEPGGRGMAFPLQVEQTWHPGLRAVLHTVAMCYIFLGVSIVADKFMNAIEAITSKKKRVKIKGTDRIITTKLWNDTVANLTLLALGSSAPEILLSIMEILMDGFHAGELGPSTIVGSAAFNLFVIIAVCIVAIPSPDTRRIKETTVFLVTAAFSLFAYFWLVFIVMISSPNVVEVWEGLMTLFLFPILCGMSYLADIGYFSSEAVSSDLCGEDFDSEQPQADLQQVPLQPNMQLQMQDQQHLYPAASQWPPFPATASATTAGFPLPLQGQPPAPKDVICDGKGRAIKNDAGILSFEHDKVDVIGGLQAKKYMIVVHRKNGTRGEVSCKYRLESLSAIPGYDYEDDHGELCFGDGISQQMISVTVLSKRLGEHSDRFQVVLEDVEGGAVFNPNDDGGKEKCILTITILNESDPLTKQSLSLRANCFFDGVVNMDALRAGNASWYDLILEAIQDTGAEEGEQPSVLDWILHAIAVPWKFMFAAFIPPVAYCGGWACFTLALFWIGFLTALIIDFAELFGCVAGVQDSVTAITFVALGTSMPDLFASKTAAVEDEWADASIVNVTGSNSVNVFLGIGVPWTLAAVYWSSVGATDDWKRKYGSYLEEWPKGAFVVEGGNLAFSVIVFSAAALVALGTIRMRRLVFGGELGGPFVAKWFSFVLFVMLWFFYIALSIWKVMAKDADLGAHVFAVFIVFVVFENVVIIAGICISLFTRKNDGIARTTRGVELESVRTIGVEHSDDRGSLLRATAGADAAAASRVEDRGRAMSEDSFMDCNSTNGSFTSTALVCLAASRLRRSIKHSDGDFAGAPRAVNGAQHQNPRDGPWPTILGSGLGGHPSNMPARAEQIHDRTFDLNHQQALSQQQEQYQQLLSSVRQPQLQNQQPQHLQQQPHGLVRPPLGQPSLSPVNGQGHPGHLQPSALQPLHLQFLPQQRAQGVQQQRWQGATTSGWQGGIPSAATPHDHVAASAVERVGLLDPSARQQDTAHALAQQPPLPKVPSFHSLEG